MIIKEIDISGEKFQLTLTEQVIGQVNQLKSLSIVIRAFISLQFNMIDLNFSYFWL